jgi:hypothetical protein
MRRAPAPSAAEPVVEPGLPWRAEARLAFPDRQLQSDNSLELSLEFSLAAQAAGIRHRYITLRRPKSDPISLDTVSTTMTAANEVDDERTEAEGDSW